MEYEINGLIIECKKRDDNDYFIQINNYLQLLKNGNNAEKKNAGQALKKHFAYLQDCFYEDLKEMKICRDAKAYKAALVLGGSCLESFLLSWLSEIDGINYFEKNYYKRNEKGEFEKNKDGKKIKSENLSDYIDRIKEINKPEWLDEAEKAHEIRKRRNCVHPKSFLKRDYEINEETCNMVENYLREIIDARLNSFNENLKSID